MQDHRLLELMLDLVPEYQGKIFVDFRNPDEKSLAVH